MLAASFVWLVLVACPRSVSLWWSCAFIRLELFDIKVNYFSSLQCLCCVLLICWLFYLFCCFFLYRIWQVPAPSARSQPSLTVTTFQIDSSNEKDLMLKKLTTIVLAERKYQKLWANKNSKQKPRTICISRKKCKCVVVIIFLLLYLFLSISLFYFIVLMIMHWNT